jgi:hypothetical protein
MSACSTIGLRPTCLIRVFRINTPESRSGAIACFEVLISRGAGMCHRTPGLLFVIQALYSAWPTANRAVRTRTLIDVPPTPSLAERKGSGSGYAAAPVRLHSSITHSSGMRLSVDTSGARPAAAVAPGSAHCDLQTPSPATGAGWNRKCWIHPRSKGTGPRRLN